MEIYLTPTHTHTHTLTFIVQVTGLKCFRELLNQFITTSATTSPPTWPASCMTAAHLVWGIPLPHALQILLQQPPLSVQKTKVLLTHVLCRPIKPRVQTRNLEMLVSVATRQTLHLHPLRWFSPGIEWWEGEATP